MVPASPVQHPSGAIRLRPLALAAGLCLTIACTGDPAKDPDAGAQPPVCVAGADCDDGEPCTINDSCLNNECLGTLLDCEDGNPCTSDACDNEARTCSTSSPK